MGKSTLHGGFMVSLGFWLVSMFFHGGFMVFHGFWLVAMVFQGIFMVSLGFWLVSMVFQGSFMVSYGFWLISWFCWLRTPQNSILAQRSSLGLAGRRPALA